MSGTSTQSSSSQWLVDWLSEERFATYLKIAGQPGAAFDLYKWNSRLSAAFLELVEWFEVAWRNNIDKAITSRQATGAPHWLLDPSFPLQEATKAKVGQAVRVVQRGRC